MIIIARAAGGISLNGKEYLLNEDQTEMEFADKETAKQFLRDNGFGHLTEEELEDEFFFENKKIVWFEIFENMGDELGTRTIDNAPTLQEALEKKKKANLTSEFTLGIDKWQQDEGETPEQIDMTKEERDIVNSFF